MFLKLATNLHVVVPAMHLNYGKRSLYYHGTIKWNGLPIGVKSLYDFELMLAML